MKIVVKRGIAYIIDIIIIFFFLFCIYKFIPKNEELLSKQSEMNEISEQYLNKEINFSTYFDEYSTLIYEMDHCKMGDYMIILIVIHIYFIGIPYFTSQTLGMKLLHLSYAQKNKEKLSIPSLWIRNIIFNGLFYYIGLILSQIVLKNQIYFINVIILGIIQILLVIISQFMIIYRKDCRGLHDILSNTKIKEEV